MAHDRRGVKSIFDEAAEIDSPAGRAAYLDRVCGGDTDLRRKVDALLVALDEAGSFQRASDGLCTASISDETIGHPDLGLEGESALAQGTTARSIGPDPDLGETAECLRPHPAPVPTVSFRPASTGTEWIGTVIAGRYKIREPIGDGGMRHETGTAA
jgi:serine/threonine-protein kinase